MWEEYGFVGLFAVSFGAATILPVSSELVFASMTGAGFDPVICIWAATAGNWLGGMTTYGLGRLGKTDWLSKYFKISSGRLEQIRGCGRSGCRCSLFRLFAGGRRRDRFCSRIV